MANKEEKTCIKEYPFTNEGAKALLLDNEGIDWPVVYILCGEDNDKKQIAYVGESSSAYYCCYFNFLPN